MTPDADALKAKGNTLFKAGKCREAAAYYAKAETADPNDSVYPSNLSAALYEMGDFSATLKAISRTWKLAQLPGSDASLAFKLRLSSRLAKSLCHGVRAGSISPDTLSKDEPMQALIKEVEAVVLDQVALSGSSPAIQESVKLWKLWRSMEQEVAHNPQVSNEARTRLSTLPIFRQASKPEVEYHTLGHDHPISLLDDWGNYRDAPIPIDTFSDDALSRIAFLVGGVGDARHVYSTLLGAHRAQKKLPPARAEMMNVHITMLDIHPAALARDLCVAMLLLQLIDVGETDKIEYAEIMATIMYVFTGVVLPPYAHARLSKIMEDLQVCLSETPLRLPQWIHINQEAVSGIQSVLTFWLSFKDPATGTNKTKFTTAGTLDAHVITPTGHANLVGLINNPSISPAYRASIEASIERKRGECEDMFQGFGAATLRSMGLTPPKASASPAEKAAYRKRKNAMIDDMCETMERGHGNAMHERDWYDLTKVFVPPPELWEKYHPGFEVFREMSVSLANRPPASHFDPINADIAKTWMPNVTLFDPRKKQYPNIELSVFETPGHIVEFDHRFEIISTDPNVFPDAPTYTHFSDFFGATAKAIKALDGHVTLEFLQGELTQELSKMSLRSDHTRPEEFPRTFTREYLSNVPDYTHGTINTIVYALPTVQNGSYSGVASSCMLNTGIWKDAAEFIYTYTLLLPEDLSRFLGCTIVDDDALQGVLTLRNTDALPLPLSRLASRDELTTWLTRVLLYTIVPARGSRTSFRARLPNNLVAFFSLLVHLHRVGFPAHWLAEFLQVVLTGKMVTDIAPFAGEWPIPITDYARRVAKRSVRLDPWLMEIQTILALAVQGLPFAVLLPDTNLVKALTHEDIGMLEAKVTSNPLEKMMGGLFSAMTKSGDPNVALMFYKPNQGVSEDDLVKAIPGILNGAASPRVGDILILTVVESIDDTCIRWRMSKERASRMRSEGGWAMLAYRTDAKESFTPPVPASKWIVVTN